MSTKQEKSLLDLYNTEEKKKEFKLFLREVLSLHEVVITFIKKDGTERVLRGTTNFEAIPTEYHPEDGKEKKYDKDKLCTIFDLDAQGWRSFSYDSLKGIKV